MTLIPMLLIVMTAVVSVPLVMKKVKPNLLYGFRTEKTMSDVRIWYEANQKAGINLMVASCSTLLFWGVVDKVAGAGRANLYTVPVFLVLVLMASAISMLQLRRM